MCAITLRRVLATAVAGVLLVPAIAGAARAAWRPPVGGAVTRAFDLGADPFEGGRHRGVDLAAPPGSAVRAPCAGRVVVAGRVGASGRVVTLRCGRWRVTGLPFAALAVRRGAAVATGTVLGTVGRSRAHAGLHLGVRREGRPFGYVDPLRFLRRGRPVRPTPVGRRGPRAPVARRFAPAPQAAPARAGSSPIRGRALAPWPAWAGLALVLAGAGMRWRGSVRMRRASAPGGLRRGVG
jgi:hypothetical protein